MVAEGCGTDMLYQVGIGERKLSAERDVAYLREKDRSFNQIAVCQRHSLKIHQTPLFEIYSQRLS